MRCVECAKYDKETPRGIYLAFVVLEFTSQVTKTVL